MLVLMIVSMGVLPHQVGPFLPNRGMSVDEPDAQPECRVCDRANLDLMEWFGCASSCAPCADFFRRVCIGGGRFVQPEECAEGFK